MLEDAERLETIIEPSNASRDAETPATLKATPAILVVAKSKVNEPLRYNPKTYVRAYAYVCACAHVCVRV